MTTFRTGLAGVALASGLAFAGAVHAGPIPYPSAGIANPTLYTFTAAATGNITAYFYGSTAGYTNELTMLVNGVGTGVFGLNNHTSTAGDALVLGAVTAGDEIVFELHNLSPGGVGPWYSKKAMNSDGVNHVYSTSYAGGTVAGHAVPAGTYVSFEDLRGGGDFNYNDENFVFDNIATTTSVPEPGSLALMLAAALGLIGASRKARGA